MKYENKEQCDRSFPPVVRNVYMQNVTCEKSEYGVLIIGLDDDKHVSNINVEDCRFNNVSTGGNHVSGARDVTYKNLYINGEMIE